MSRCSNHRIESSPTVVRVTGIVKTSGHLVRINSME